MQSDFWAVLSLCARTAGACQLAIQTPRLPDRRCPQCHQWEPWVTQRLSGCRVPHVAWVGVWACSLSFPSKHPHAWTRRPTNSGEMQKTWFTKKARIGAHWPWPMGSKKGLLIKTGLTHGKIKGHHDQVMPLVTWNSLNSIRTAWVPPTEEIHLS